MKNSLICPKIAIALAFIMLISVATASMAGVTADYGDAPDNTYDPGLMAYPGVPAHFPSFYNTANSAFPGYTGVYHINVDNEWVDSLETANTTTEDDALVGFVESG